MLTALLERLRASGVKRVIVGTSSSGIGQLAYYQKAGFRLWKIERDFFSAERGYPEGGEENGHPSTRHGLDGSGTRRLEIAGRRGPPQVMW